MQSGQCAMLDQHGNAAREAMGSHALDRDPCAHASSVCLHVQTCYFCAGSAAGRAQPTWLPSSQAAPACPPCCRPLPAGTPQTPPGPQSLPLVGCLSFVFSAMTCKLVASLLMRGSQCLPANLFTITTDSVCTAPACAALCQSVELVAAYFVRSTSSCSAESNSSCPVQRAQSPLT